MTLTVWPCLPIFVQQRQYGLPGGDSDNIVAALEHNDRVCEIDLFDVSSSHLEKALAGAISIPVLTNLEIRRKDDDGTPPVVSDSFISRLDTRVPLSQNFVPTKAVSVIPEMIFGITETAFFYHSHRLSLPLENSPFWLHFTRGDRPLPLRIDKARKTFFRIRIPSIYP
jgi:hypothetical protein